PGPGRRAISSQRGAFYTAQDALQRSTPKGAAMIGRFGVCYLLMLLADLSSARAAERPANVIFMLADDLGYAELGCYGQKIIQTPNLDRLAADGMRFTQAYCGNAVCAPSRCGLMTGKHPGHAWVRDNGDP